LEPVAKAVGSNPIFGGENCSFYTETFRNSPWICY